MLHGWHAYLFYQKNKNAKLFSHHVIRNSLYLIWRKYSRFMGGQRPSQLVPIEIIKLHSEYSSDEKLNYDELTYWKSNEITLKEEKDIPANLRWWRYSQIKSLFEMDKRKFGFKKEQNQKRYYWETRKNGC